MAKIDKIIAFSKRTTASLLGLENPTDLENSELYNEKGLGEIKENTETGERFKQINQRESWKTLKREIQHTTRALAYWIYATAASVAAIIAIVFFLNKTDVSKIDTPILANGNIEIGTDKATLTLEDGSNIPLEKGTTYQSENVNSNGEELVYNTNGSAKTEIAYNHLTVPRGGQFFVQLSDSTKVWLNSDSRLKYPVTFVEGKTRTVELVYGEAYFEVSPSTAHNGATFKVLNQAQEIEVLGTEFNIKAYREDTHIYTTLVEGKVAVSNMTTKQNLAPNQQTTLNLKTNHLTITTVDIRNETSWKEGLFSFKDKSLKEIMKVLSRWYDFDVVFVDGVLENVKFSGVLRKNQDIKDILMGIKNTNLINTYDIKDNTILIK